MSDRYAAAGAETEYEPGSRSRVLRNRLGIVRVRDMEQAESEALVEVQDALLDRYTFNHQFNARDVCEIHRGWLGDIYAWAGEYRTVQIAKGGFMFAAVGRIPQLMEQFERNELADQTPCAGMDSARLARALAHTHGELVLIHPFREGNGRCARVLAYLMAVQAGMPSLDFSVFAGRGKRAYVAAIHAAVGRDYEPLRRLFDAAISRTWSAYESRR